MINILLEAPILTQSGYGEHSRLVYKSLSNLEGVAIYTNPLLWGQTGWLSHQIPFYEDIEKSIKNFALHEEQNKNVNSFKYDIQIHVGILNEFEKKAKKSIVVTAGIETDRVSADWLLRTHQGVDKLIVPSKHAKFGFDTTAVQISRTNGQKDLVKCNSQVEVVPYPVKDLKSEDLDLNLKTNFNFLTVGLLGLRKNVENSILWFVEEFKDNPDVGLIVKTSKSTGSTLDRVFTTSHLTKILENHKDAKCKVYLLHGDLTEEQIHGLYTRKDVKGYITTTHGEGYGLPIFEAAYSGLPIVATDWSGHLDFLQGPYKHQGKTKTKKLFLKVDYDLKDVPAAAVWKDIIVEGSQWAYPKKESFKKKIRSLYKDYGMYKKWSSQLQEHIVDSYEESQILNKMRVSIFGELAPDLEPDNNNIEWNKKLSKIEVLQ